MDFLNSQQGSARLLTDEEFIEMYRNGICVFHKYQREECRCGLSKGEVAKHWMGVHKPCLARAAVTSSASVASCGDSSILRLPDEDMWLCLWGEVQIGRAHV